MSYSEYFEKYSSTTIGAGANQSFFEMNEGEIRTSLAFFKAGVTGRHNYSLLFSDVIDSTFADGSKSRANMKLGGWRIESLKVGRCKRFSFADVKEAETNELAIDNLVSLTFDGASSKAIPEGESAYSDPVSLEFFKDEYIAVEISYSGRRIPSHPESMLPLYRKTDSGYVYSVDMPLPLMIGCDRSVKGRIGYLGDSITQGIGAGFNTYGHWCARLSEMIGWEYSHYNLGIGYARASDAATGGDWLRRAESCDTVFICLGTNDVAHDPNGAKAIADSLNSIICKLKAANCRIILQTAPPFDREGERRTRWFELNDIIRNELSKKALYTFDNVPVLRLSEEFPEKARYGGHPDSTGCAAWAAALYESIKNYF